MRETVNRTVKKIAQDYFDKGLISQDYNEKVLFYSNAIELDPSYVLAYINKGYALNNLNRHDEAIQCFDKCYSFSFSLNFNWSGAASPYKCIWDKSYYGSTIVTDWYLVCDKEYMTGLTQTIFMIGALNGFFMGFFSDKYGRKKICLLMVILMFLAILVSQLLIHFNIFSFNVSFFNANVNANYFIYCISQYMIGFSSFTCYVTSYVLLLEITTSA